MALSTSLTLTTYIFAAATIFCASYAQKTATDAGCIMSTTECTCAQSASAGDCTRPTDEGKCLQDDCSPSHKCDCFGYELCSISTCGKWAPAANALVSRTAEFPCKYEGSGSKCRAATALLDTITSADNAKTAAAKYVDDVAADEVEMAAYLTQALQSKIQTLDAFRSITTRVDEVTAAELREVADLADMVVAEIKSMAKEIAEASDDASEAYAAMGKAVHFRSIAREHDAAAEADELAEEEGESEAKAKGTACEHCAATRERITERRKALRVAAKEAGAWSKKGRHAKQRAAAKRLSAKNRKTKIERTNAQCVARAQRVLNRLGGVSGI